MQYRCDRCSEPLGSQFATALAFRCPCGGALVPARAVAPDAGFAEIDATRLPYPVALTLARLRQLLAADASPLASLFAVKDCFEAGVKFLGSVLVAEYLSSPARTPDRDAVLLEKLVRPALGHWVNEICRPASEWLGAGTAALLFSTPGKGKPTQTELFRRCRAFVDYRNDALGHGAARSDARYREDLNEKCLPVLAELLTGLATLADRPLLLVTDEDRAQVWMGAEPSAATVPGAFRRDDIGRFVLAPNRSAGGALTLFPFLCYLPGPTNSNRLHFYDSVYRYTATRKEATVLEYDGGERHPRPEPLVGFEDAFTADLLAQAFKVYRGRMAVIEGRVANFGELIEAHAGIVGRKFAIERVYRFLRDNDCGLLVIEAEPGKGKTALVAHLIEEVFGGSAPRPVHFFYRRTAGITDPDVCVKSLYHALLDAHGITETAESQARQAPEEVYTKLVNLLAEQIGPRLSPGRPQLIFIDALDEANGNALRRIPENLPAGVYVIATTRPVAQRATLARRSHLHWFDLDDPDLLADNLSDGHEYVKRELVGADVPPATQDELARVGGGNFLVLKLLCGHVRAHLAADAMPGFLKRLATGSGAEQLGFIYEEFWQRIAEKCPPEFAPALYDVAGVLVLAHAPLTRDVIASVLGLNTAAWDFALRGLAEYLTAIRDAEAGAEETFYRVYHESFADFLRAKLVEGDRARLRGLLADYCTAWDKRPEGYGRLYALQFGLSHLREANRVRQIADLALSTTFLKAVRQLREGLHDVRVALVAGLGAALSLSDRTAIARGVAEGHRLLSSTRLLDVDLTDRSTDHDKEINDLIVMAQALSPPFDVRYLLLLSWRALRGGDIAACRRGVSAYLARSHGCLAYEESHLFAPFFEAAWRAGVPGAGEAWLRVHPPCFVARGLLAAMRADAPAIPRPLFDLYERLLDAHRLNLDETLPPRSRNEADLLPRLPHLPDLAAIDHAEEAAIAVESRTTRMASSLIGQFLASFCDIENNAPDALAAYATTLRDELRRTTESVGDTWAEILRHVLAGERVPDELAARLKIRSTLTKNRDGWGAVAAEYGRAATVAEVAALLGDASVANIVHCEVLDWIEDDRLHTSMTGANPFRDGSDDQWTSLARVVHALLRCVAQAPPTGAARELARASVALCFSDECCWVYASAAAGIVHAGLPQSTIVELFRLPEDAPFYGERSGTDLIHNPTARVASVLRRSTLGLLSRRWVQACVLLTALRLHDKFEFADVALSERRDQAIREEAVAAFMSGAAPNSVARIVELLDPVEAVAELPFGYALAVAYAPDARAALPCFLELPGGAERDFLLYILTEKLGGVDSLRCIIGIESVELRIAAAVSLLACPTPFGSGLSDERDVTVPIAAEALLSVISNEIAVTAVSNHALRLLESAL